MPKESVQLLRELVDINSCTDNIAGIDQVAERLCAALAFAGSEKIALSDRPVVDERGAIGRAPVADMLRITVRPEIKRRALLVGHMDTVFPKNLHRPSSLSADGQLMYGHGTADMKGGLVILVEALRIFESSPHAQNIGWDLLLTTDEEVGSPSSKEILQLAAKKAAVGLIFEPAFENGNLASQRKGSATLTLVVHGKAAHAGRHPELGVSAIFPLAALIDGVKDYNGQKGHAFINIGKVTAGQAANIIPGLAIAKIGVRADTKEALDDAIAYLQRLSQSIGGELFEQTRRPPKPFDRQTEALFQSLKEIDETIDWQPTGGVCDGNFLAEAGLPTIDTLGAVGGAIHTDDEFIRLDSLTARSRLTAAFLEAFAKNNMAWEE